MPAPRRRRTSVRGPRDPRRAGHVDRNRRLWEAQSEEYERLHRRSLGAANAEAWGFFRLPEARLNLLGPIRGRRILELGCGAGRWSASVKRRGGRPVGLDVSRSRLRQARGVQVELRTRYPLLRADAEKLPFRGESFDVAFGDWGAMTFCDPYRTVPEVARVLRPGGTFVFSNSSPFRTVAHERERDRLGRWLRYDYFELHRVDYPGEVNFQLGYGEWVRLFRENAFRIDQLLEPRAPLQPKSSYLSVTESAWGRRWPLESIWRLVKDPPR
jgi:SAM-dependent methyltransferase